MSFGMEKGLISLLNKEKLWLQHQYEVMHCYSKDPTSSLPLAPCLLTFLPSIAVPPSKSTDMFGVTLRIASICINYFNEHAPILHQVKTRPTWSWSIVHQSGLPLTTISLYWHHSRKDSNRRGLSLAVFFQRKRGFQMVAHQLQMLTGDLWMRKMSCPSRALYNTAD